MRIAVVIALCLSGVAAAAPDSSYVTVTKKAFGPHKAGKKLDEAAVKKIFPAATVKSIADGKEPSWLIKDPATGLRAVASPRFIVINGGKIEIHGVEPGDDGGKLAAKELKGLECFPMEGRLDFVQCNLPWLTVMLNKCPTQGDSISRTKLKGCTIHEIWWLPLGRRG